jgi:5'(3')-deoxyribonucleotidase
MYDLSEVWRCSAEEVYKRVFEFYNSPEFIEVKPIQGSQKGIKEIAKKHNLHLITSRPHEIEQKTRQWINVYFPKVFTTITHTNQVSKQGKGNSKKKSEIGKMMKIDIMIDDHITYALDCADNEILTLLFEAPWNKSMQITHGYIKKVASWEEICYTISHESQKPHHQNRTSV